MRILHHTLNYPPDGNSTADLQGELGVELSRLGHDVVALTATPNANQDAEAEGRQPLTRRWFGLLFTSEHQGVRVFHASIPVKGSRVAGRIKDYLRFCVLSVAAGATTIPRPDAVLVISPPLTIGISGWIVARARRARFVYVVQEIYPDIAVSLGVLTNPRVIRLMEALERFIYGRADRIVVISDWFERRLIEKGVPGTKIEVIQNFVDAEFVAPGPRRNSFSTEHGLDERFVALYAGNIGLTQSLESLLAAATRLEDIPDIQIVVIGGGTRFAWLSSEVETGRYPNVILLPYQPRSLVPEMYAACDVGLVPLKAGTARETFPSKIYTIMAAGRPAIASADADTELTWVVEEARCGWAVGPDDPVSLADAITGAFERRDQLPAMGMRGRAYVELHHAKPLVVGMYADLLESLVASMHGADSVA